MPVGRFVPTNLTARNENVSFAPNADARLTALAESINGNPDYTVVIESHTDNEGAPDELQSLTNDRAQAIVSRLTSLSVPAERIRASGMGATLPVAANSTPANRSKNRRVQVIFSPIVN